MHVMIAQHVANVLAKKALDALPELLHPVHVFLLHPPAAIGSVRLARFELSNRLLDSVSAQAVRVRCARVSKSFQLTSVTRSRISGNVFIGSTRTGLSGGSVFMRVMHISFGMPLISAEHDPHLPALQFHRTAMSLACSAWIL
jgi:hypothetical protein